MATPPVNPHIIRPSTTNPRPKALLPWPLAVGAAWVLPGLGHVLIGHARRGLIAGAAILALFTAGILVGGLCVIDRKADPVPLWYAGQTLVGPVTLALDRYHQNLKIQLTTQIDQHAQTLRQILGRRVSYEQANADLLQSTTTAPVFRKSLGRVNELGTLYCTLAGVLNLLLILDVVGRATDPKAGGES